jgi:hypothetical protein
VEHCIVRERNRKKGDQSFVVYCFYLCQNANLLCAWLYQDEGVKPGVLFLHASLEKQTKDTRVAGKTELDARSGTAGKDMPFALRGTVFDS